MPTVLPSVVAVALVGSHARDAARPDSDVDLVVLTDRAADMLARTDWFALFDPAAVLIRSGDFGAIQERRLRLPDSTVVEIGVGAPGWAHTDPVAAGTRRVVGDGLRILYDPHDLLAALARAVRGPG